MQLKKAHKAAAVATGAVVGHVAPRLLHDALFAGAWEHVREPGWLFAALAGGWLLVALFEKGHGAPPA